MRRSTLVSLLAGSILLSASLFQSGCGVETETAQEELAVTVASPSSEGGARDPRIMPMRTPGIVKFDATATKLKYYGGHVISNAKVVAVFWGSGVDSTTKGFLPPFYTAVVNSAHMDWLSEYDTNIKSESGAAGTNQHIGRGTFSAAYTISPSKTSGTISDTQIQTELNSQIKSGKLPAPDDNTVYMVSFPKGLKITLGGATSCSTFCAYHNTGKTDAGKNLIYSVLPYLGSGSGCETGCGSGVYQDDTTAVASHELIEAVTDPEIGLVTGSSIGAPAAWYDEVNGEIADICNAESGTLPGTSYKVQAEWSNKAGKCIVTAGTCAPSCSGKSCGPDGCGGTCGTCASGKTCNSSGQCVTSCTPSCTGKTCGSDGCGGSCGSCASGQTCTSSGTCTGGGTTCSHDMCKTGKKLAAACDPCVSLICSYDSYCCSTKWDATCVSEVTDICGESC
jgi:hypothetical protein